MASRFHDIPRSYALAVLVLVLGLMVLAFPRLSSPHEAAIAKADAFALEKTDNPDLLLYNSIIARVARGEDYYPVAAQEQRNQGYPLRPFVTFRLPTLAVFSAALGVPMMRAMLWMLMACVAMAWWIRLKHAFDVPKRRVSGTLLVVSGLTLAGRPELVVAHEIWAGALIALSLGVHRVDRWWPSLALALMAVVIRELAVPFLMLMAALALFGRRWRECAGWILAILLFAAVMLLHARHVAAVVLPTDPASPGWASFGGWPFFVSAMRMTSALRALPDWLGNLIVPLSLLGWASWRSFTGMAGALLLGGYAVMLMLFGRTQNFYWGLLVSPLLLLGLAFLPRALPDLFRSAFPKQL